LQNPRSANDGGGESLTDAIASLFGHQYYESPSSCNIFHMLTASFVGTFWLLWIVILICYCT